MDCGVRDLSKDVQTIPTISTCKAIPALHQMHELEACVNMVPLPVLMKLSSFEQLVFFGSPSSLQGPHWPPLRHCNKDCQCTAFKPDPALTPSGSRVKNSPSVPTIFFKTLTTCLSLKQYSQPVDCDTFGVSPIRYCAYQIFIL